MTILGVDPRYASPNEYEEEVQEEEEAQEETMTVVSSNQPETPSIILTEESRLQVEEEMVTRFELLSVGTGQNLLQHVSPLPQLPETVVSRAFQCLPTGTTPQEMLQLAELSDEQLERFIEAHPDARQTYVAEILRPGAHVSEKAAGGSDGAAFEEEKAPLVRALSIDSSFKAEAKIFEDCAVCLEPMESKTRLACGHMFCTDCVKKTYGRLRTARCPKCREMCPEKKNLRCF